MTSPIVNESKSNAAILENPYVDSSSTYRMGSQTLELGYDDTTSSPSPVCFACGKQQGHLENTKLSKCAKCHIASYCSRECQVQDWKQEGRPKLACPSYARLHTLDSAATREQVRNEVFSRIRFYACPYAVHKSSELGNGFLFIQSDTTLQDLSIAIPKDRFGRAMTTRSILMHYLTIGEYDAEVCRDDFEMATVRNKLQDLVKDYDLQKETVILLRLRCGHVALGKAAFVPDYRVCKTLGKDYYANNPASAIQLTLDDL